MILSRSTFQKKKKTPPRRRNVDTKDMQRPNSSFGADHQWNGPSIPRWHTRTVDAGHTECHGWLCCQVGPYRKSNWNILIQCPQQVNDKQSHTHHSWLHQEELPVSLQMPYIKDYDKAGGADLNAVRCVTLFPIVHCHATQRGWH